MKKSIYIGNMKLSFHEIILIFTICFSMLITAIVYFDSLEKYKKSTVQIKHFPYKIFKDFELFSEFYSNIDYGGKKYNFFFNDYKNLILSETNFQNFLLKKKDNFLELTDYLISNNNTIEDIVNSKNFYEIVQRDNNKNKPPIFSFNYPELIRGEIYLNEYINYSYLDYMNKIRNSISESLELVLLDLNINKKNFVEIRKKEINAQIFLIEKNIDEYMIKRKKELEGRISILKKDLEEFYYNYRNKNLVKIKKYERALRTAEYLQMKDIMPAIKDRSVEKPAELFYLGANALKAEIKNIYEALEEVKYSEVYNGINERIINLQNKSKMLESESEYIQLNSKIFELQNQITLIKRTSGYIEFEKNEKNIKSKIDLLNEMHFNNFSVISSYAVRPNSYSGKSLKYYLFTFLIIGLSISFFLIYLKRNNYFAK